MRKKNKEYLVYFKKALVLIIVINLSACVTKAIKPIAASSQSKAISKETSLYSAAEKHFITQAKIPNVIRPLKKQAEKKIYPKFSVSLTRVPVVELMQSLAKDAKLELIMSGSLSGTISLTMNNSALIDILDAIVLQLPIRYRLKGRRLSVFEDIAVSKIYHVDYLNIARHSVSDIDLATQIDSISLSMGDKVSASTSNNSSARIKNVSTNEFWKKLKQNLEDIVALSSINNKVAAVIINQESGLLVIQAKHKVHIKIKEFLDRLSNSVQKQVFIEALVVEVSLKDEYQAGIDWRVLSSDHNGTSYLQNFSNSSTVNAQNAASIGAPNALLSFVKKAVNGHSGITATLTLLEKYGSVKILSSPKISALNNQAAVLKVVDNRVYFSIGAQRIKVGDGLEQITTTSEIKTVPIGLVMHVIPYISDNNDIMLNVRPTISRIIGYVSDPNPDLIGAGIKNLVPEIQVREMESVLRVKSGGLVVIGGLMQEQSKNERTSVPFLSKIPLLGRLFRFDREVQEKTELLVFIRPVVITGDQDYKEEIKQYL
jgi:general secretion pathway protein D